MNEKLKYFIAEREKIRKLKENDAPKPWSDDPVFQTVYFCNVHREDDKTTKWIRKNYSSWVTHSLFLPNIMMARLVNRVESLEALQYFPRDFYEEWFREIATTRQPFWGGAYVVTTHGRPMSKLDYACEILGEAFKYPPDLSNATTLRAAWEILQGYEGFASFMSAQVVADLKNTEGHPLELAPDWYSFSAPGPGSLRGLSWYFDKKITPPQYQEAILQASKDIGWGHCMQDLQNVFCEFDKYCRVEAGTGRSKRKYHGQA